MARGREVERCASAGAGAAGGGGGRGGARGLGVLRCLFAGSQWSDKLDFFCCPPICNSWLHHWMKRISSLFFVSCKKYIPFFSTL